MITRSGKCVVQTLALIVGLVSISNASAEIKISHPESTLVATPNPVESRAFNYVASRNKPLPEDQQFNSVDHEDSAPDTSASYFAPSNFILTILRTILDVVRNMNKAKHIQRLPMIGNISNSTKSQTKFEARGMMHDDDDHHHHDETTMAPKPRYTDPWAGYYDFIINEGSYKFWVVFQLFTAGLLLYSCFAAIYYAKFNPITPDYDREYDDYFLGKEAGRRARSLDGSLLPSGLSWMNTPTFQFIMDAISKKYLDES